MTPSTATTAERLPALLAELAQLLAVPSSSPDPLQLFDADEAAALLKMSKAGVYEAVRRKQLGHVKATPRSRGGRKVVFTRDQFANFIASRSSKVST
jgi:hypothetical protein